jgi:putative copper export protein
VFALAVSGLYSAWAETRSLEALTTSTYGYVLLAKVGASVPALILGGVNNRWTKPRILRAAHEEHPSGAGLLTLRRLVGLETVVLAVVLALTVFLVILLPPVRTFR